MTEAKYYVKRKTGEVFIVKETHEGIVVRAEDRTEVPLAHHELSDKEYRYSKIPEQAYMEFARDNINKRKLAEMKEAMENFAKNALIITSLWDQLSDNVQHSLGANEYPFDDSFEEIAEKIGNWAEWHEDIEKL